MFQEFEPSVHGIHEHMGCLVQIETPTKFVGRYNKYRHEKGRMIAIKPYMVDITTHWNARNRDGTFTEFYVADNHKAWCLRHSAANGHVESAEARNAIRAWLAENYPNGYPMWSNTELDIIIRLVKELNNGTNS